MVADDTAYRKDLAGVVEFMRTQPGMVEEVLAAHVPNHNGDCKECSGYRSVVWPCVHSLCAAQAKALLPTGRRPTGERL